MLITSNLNFSINSLTLYRENMLNLWSVFVFRCKCQNVEHLPQRWRTRREPWEIWCSSEDSKNAVLGQRNKATVEIVDPRNGRKKFSIPTFCSFCINWEYFCIPGRCHPDELIVEEDEKHHPDVQSPPHVPEPEPPLLEEYTPDPRTGIL